MGIKSQQDIKNASEAQKAKVPKSMEGKVKEVPQAEPKVETTKIERKRTEPKPTIEDVVAHINAIETYLEKADKAFSTLASEMDKVHIQVHSLDAEVSKLTGVIIRLTQLDEDRYIEIVSSLELINEKISVLDETIPVFVDQKIENYFEESVEEPEEPESSDKQ